MSQQYLKRPTIDPFINMLEELRSNPQSSMLPPTIDKRTYRRQDCIWVIMHRHINDISRNQSNQLYQQYRQAFHTMKAKSDNDLPFCADFQALQKWIKKDHKCKVAVDQSVGDDIFKVLDEENVVEVKVVASKNNELINKLRASQLYSYKITGIVGSFSEILEQIKQEMEKITVEATTNKIHKTILPNFMKMRVKDKADLIKYRNSIYCLTNLHNSSADFANSKQWFVKKAEKEYFTLRQIDDIRRYRCQMFNDKEILCFYSEDSFFFKCLNNGLRIAKHPEDFMVIGQPLNKMFHAIKSIYKEQYPYNVSRKNLKLYRGANLSPSQCQYLQKCIGSFIQMHGFISTSQNVEVAKGFAKDNKLIEIVFDDIEVADKNILQNDYGFVNMQQISRYGYQKQILFNVLSIFKVVGKEQRQGWEVYILKHGTMFNILDTPDPKTLPSKQDQWAYYTYKQLMGKKEDLQDLGQIYLNSNETQKSVKYYQSKVQEVKDNKQLKFNFTIKKCQALIQNGEPAKALQNIQRLIEERETFQITQTGAKFSQSVLNSKQEIIKQIDLSKKYSEAGQDLDEFDEVQSQLQLASEALKDALQMQQKWDFDVAFGQLQIQIQLGCLKEANQSWQQALTALRQAQRLADAIIEKIEVHQISFNNTKKIYLQKTLIYQLMARISSHFQGQFAINLVQLQERFTNLERVLVQFVQKQSYDESLIRMRKAQIQNNRKDFKVDKKEIAKAVLDSLSSIKKSSTRDSEIPKGYHLLAEIEKSSYTVAGIKSAISYHQKEYFVNNQYYTQNDPKSIKTVIDIARCQRRLRNSLQSIQLLKKQLTIVPFKNKQKHTVVSKTLYTMGLAYLDLNEHSLALKALQQALNILREILSKKQYDKYHERFEIQLQIGRTLTFLQKYNKAEEHLNSYYNFTVKIHQKYHTDIANALNYFGILYSKMKNYKKSRLKFEECEQILKNLAGQKSLICAKINCNLAIFYSYFHQYEKALACLDKASFLFNQIYIQESKQGQMPVHRQSSMMEYYKAEIYNKSEKCVLAIKAYNMSIDKLQKFKNNTKMQQESFSKLVSTSLRSHNSIIYKTDKHELICRWKIIQCQIKIKDYSFEKDQLPKLIEGIQFELQEFNYSRKNDIICDQAIARQLSDILDECKRLQAAINIKNNFKFKRNSVI